MSLQLSKTTIGRLQQCWQVLLSPFLYPNGDSWKEAACDAIESLLGGHASTFTIPIPGEPLIAGNPKTVSLLSVLLPPPDWLVYGLTVRRRALGLNVADWSEIHDVRHLRRTSFYHDVVRPNRLLAPIAMATDLDDTVLPAVHATCFDGESSAQRHLEHRRLLLQLLRPAFDAGVRAYIGLRAERDNVRRLGEIVGAGLLLFGIDGQVVDQNQLLQQVLAKDPERLRVIAHAKRIASNITIALKHPNQIGASPYRTTGEARTVTGCYRFAATLIREPLTLRPFVAVVVQRASTTPFTSAELASQFHLTTREVEVAELLRLGLSGRQIATNLGISINTSRRHTERVLGKMGVHSRAVAASRLNGQPRRVEQSPASLDIAPVVSS
jgi:DNA-binding CsgD family transcriptional regulator